MTGWIKLHRRILENPVFRQDRTAWHLFETLLILADRQGEWRGGMFQLSELTGIKRATIYKAVIRLKNAKMVNTSVNSQFTTYSICKWTEYQGDGKQFGSQPVDAGETLGNTITRKKEVKNVRKDLISSPDSEALRLTELLRTLTAENYPQLKSPPVTEAACKEIERLHLLDKYPYEVIEAVIRWSQQDEFWKQNIRSAAKLRKQFDQLLIRAQAKASSFVDLDAVMQNLTQEV